MSLRRRTLRSEGDAMRKWTTDGIADGSEPYGDIVISGDVRAYAFYNNNGITSVVANAMQSFNTYLFCQCKSIKAASLNAQKVVNGGAACFYGCTALQKADLGDNVKYLAVLFFRDCTALRVVILRRKAVVTLANTDLFVNTPFAAGGAGGTVYVPADLIESYKTASGWADLYALGTVTFAQIEGSEYE